MLHLISSLFLSFFAIKGVDTADDTGMACPYERPLNYLETLVFSLLWSSGRYGHGLPVCLLVKAPDLLIEFSPFCCFIRGANTGGDTGTAC
jgi:hypothetical protein